ncbi:MAG: hypothetical protein IT287_08610, partial [Bdellovibrionaceae bacterium]|nr:hypothetical protein [Pseudobdellovibrionaceae bacterium]
MKLYTIIITLVLSNSAMASDFQFESLYEADGFVTERLLPFYIKSKTNSSFSIEKVVVEKPCYGMVDLHRANLVHVYCTEATDTDFGVRVKKDGKLYEVRAPVFK